MRAQRLLLVEDDEAVVFGYTRYLANSEYQVKSAGNLQQAKDLMGSEDFDGILLDLRLPDGNSIDWIEELRKDHNGLAIVVITGGGDVPTAVKAMKNGADNFLIKPVNVDELLVSLSKSLELGSLRKRTSIQQRLSQRDMMFPGSGPVMKKVMEHAAVAAAEDSVVLLTGETGTGKGVLARWIHGTSPRQAATFVELNCSTLRGELLRSELFGHTRGAFTSAVKDRPGLIEAADGGTLFLDEIGDMDLEVQAQLLKTIEEKTFRRIGENRVRSSDFRLICATHRNLADECEKGTFRKDLYYRICVFPVHLPPLRERAEDIPGLAESILKSFGYSHLPLSAEMNRMLAGHTWHGNIRELRNMLERARLLAQGGPLSKDHFPGLLPILTPAIGGNASWDMDEMEKQHLLRALEHFGGDKPKVSKELGISLSALYRRLEKLKI